MAEKLLIAYFSRKGENYVGGKIEKLAEGNTEKIARRISELTGGRLLCIEPAEAYPDNYRECVKRASEELSANLRPALRNMPESLGDFDTLVLGYPNYCGTMPMPVWSFLEKYDLTGKTILPFCSNEGSGMGHSETDIRRLAVGSRLEAGFSVRGAELDETALKDWLGL